MPKMIVSTSERIEPKLLMAIEALIDKLGELCERDDTNAKRSDKLIAAIDRFNASIVGLDGVSEDIVQALNDTYMSTSLGEIGEGLQRELSYRNHRLPQNTIPSSQPVCTKVTDTRVKAIPKKR